MFIAIFIQVYDMSDEMGVLQWVEYGNRVIV